MTYNSEDFDNFEFIHNAFEEGINKCKELVREIYGEIVIDKENIDKDNFKYSISFSFNENQVVIEYGFEDLEPNLKKELVKIHVNRFRVINFDRDVEVAYVIQFLEEQYGIEIVPLDHEERDKRIVTIINEDNFKTTFLSDDTYISATFSKNVPSKLNIIERDTQLIYLD